MSVHDEKKDAPYRGNERRSHPYKAGPAANSDIPQLLRMAKREISDRNVREQIFKAELIERTVWDILLELYIANFEGEHLSGTALAAATQMPRSTIHRHIAMLEDEDLVEKLQSDDGRIKNIILTRSGFAKMSDYFVQKVMAAT